jgi:hydrophobe/amphiphile efflux-3 (HAE3) family protein
MLEKILGKTQNVFKYPKLVIAITAVITIIMLYGMKDIVLDNDIQNFMPKSHQAVKDFEKYNAIFGSSDFIFMGVESQDIYTAGTLTYMKDVETKIRGLNRTIPAENLSMLFKINKDEARQLIDGLSEQVIMDEKGLKALLTDKARLENELLWDADFAAKIAKKAAMVDMEKALMLYQPPVSKVESIINTDFIKGEKDKLVVKKLLENGEVNDKNIALLKERIDSWDVYKGGLVSDDGKMAVMLVQLSSKAPEVRTAVINQTREITQKSLPQGIKVHISGEPVLSFSITDYVLKDIMLLVPIIIIVVIVMLWLSFGNLQGVLLPLLNVILSAIWTVGLISYLGIQVNIMLAVMPVILVAVGTAYPIHFLNAYFISPLKDKRRIINTNMVTVGVGIVMAGLTTVAGFGSLATTNFVPIRNFGIFTSIGVMFALIIAMYVIPSLIIIGKKEKTVFSHEDNEKNKKGFIVKLLNVNDRFVKNDYKAILIASVMLVAAGIYGMTRMNVEINMMDFFKKTDPLRVADAVINEKLSGTQIMDLVLETKDQSRITRPDILDKLEEFDRDIRKEFPSVRKTMSLNSALKKMNQEMNGGKPEQYTVPATEGRINDYLLLFSGDTKSFLSEKKDKLRMSISTSRVATNTLIKMKEYIMKYFDAGYLDKNGLNLVVTGSSNMYMVSNKLITDGQVWNIITSLIAVSVINFFSFGSLLLTLISIVPLTVCILINFGLMGFLGIPLNVGTSMVSSVAIGTGVDYAIHFIVKFKQEMAETDNMDASIRAAIMQRGRSIFYNVLAIMAGFLVLALSKFVLLMQFGVLVAFTMAITGIGAVTIVPALLKVFYKHKILKKITN